MANRESILERERRWLLPAGIASVAGVALIVPSFVGVSSLSVAPGPDLPEVLRGIEVSPGEVTTLSIIQAFGWLLLIFPLVLLFRAAANRTAGVRKGLIGLLVIAPLFLATASIFGVVRATEAASEFAGPQSTVRSSCARDYERFYISKPSASDACEELVAEETLRDSSATSVSAGLFFAGVLGFTIGLVYTALWSLRTGLLTRFWGSLGIALGAVFVLFPFFSMVWFIYLGLLLAGWVPGGRPPAWASGEARPWPKGGPLFGGGGGDDGEPGDSVIEGDAEEVPADEMPSSPELPEPADHGQVGEPPRKRKKRDS